jgi:hypothetical protein
MFITTLFFFISFFVPLFIPVSFRSYYFIFNTLFLSLISPYSIPTSFPFLLYNDNHTSVMQIGVRSIPDFVTVRNRDTKWTTSSTVTPHGLTEVHQRLREIHCLHVQGLRVSHARSQQESGSRIIFLRTIGGLSQHYKMSNSTRQNSL